MSDKRTAKNLRLEDDEGESGTYIRLEDTGKDLADRWRLQAGETPSDWQPVEYDRPSRGGVGWILPLIIGAALVGLIGLMIYAGIDRLRNSDIASSIPFLGDGNSAVVEGENGDETIVANAVEGEEGSASTEGSETVEPAVVLQPTATLEPEPTESSQVAESESNAEAEPTAVLIEEEIGIISNQYGVNARLQPSTASDVLRILEQDEEVLILDQLSDTENDIEWLQVLTSEDAEVWVAADFVDITTRLVALETGEVVETIAGGATSTSRDPNEFALADSDVTVPAIINSQYGLNARTSPSADTEPVRVLDDGSAVTAIQRSDDGEWIQVQLDSNERFWVSSGFIAADGDLNTLLSSSEVALRIAEESAPKEPEVEITEPEAQEPGPKEPIVEVADAPAPVDSSASDGDAGGSILISVKSPYGANARSTSNVAGEALQVIEENVELQAIGRTANSAWVQAPLEDGTLAWLFTQTLNLPDDISTLPVVAGPAVGQPAEKLPEPLADSAGETATDDAGEATDSEAAADDAGEAADSDATTDDAGEAADSEAEAAEATDEVTSTAPLTSTVTLTSTDTTTGTLTSTDITTDTLTSTDTVTSTDTTTDTNASASDVISVTETITETLVSTTTVDSSAAVTTTETITSTDSESDEPVAVTATITSLLDAKARPSPNAGEDPIQDVPSGIVLSATGRTADGFWVQVQLTDGTPAWVFANNVKLSTDIKDLPAVIPEN